MEYELRKKHKTQRGREANRIKKRENKEIWRQITANAKLNLNTIALRESGGEGFVFFYAN